MFRILKTSLLLLTLMGFAPSLLMKTAMAIEEPNYRVIQQFGAIELRVYDPKIIAEVEVEGALDSASRKGFKLIATYIFGGNISSQGNSEKISMTAPVTTSKTANTTNLKTRSEKISMTSPVTVKGNNNKWRVHFVMPKKYSLKTLPKPKNPAVTIRQVEGSKYAVIRFSGLAGKTKADKKIVELKKWLQSKNIKPKGEPELARYNPPWTLPFLRRNEILIKY